MGLIRAAGENDLEAVRALLREYAAYLNASVGEEHICLAQYEKELASLPAPYGTPDGTILLGFVRDEPAGVIALKPLKLAGAATMGERSCEMKRLWVRPQFRGLNLGRMLSEQLIEHARALGYTAIYLDTMPATMASAYRIYRDLGFMEVERYGDNPVLRLPAGCADANSPRVVFLRREL